jgi:hypothetical protein
LRPYAFSAAAAIGSSCLRSSIASRR